MHLDCMIYHVHTHVISTDPRAYNSCTRIRCAATYHYCYTPLADQLWQFDTFSCHLLFFLEYLPHWGPVSYNSTHDVLSKCLVFHHFSLYFRDSVLYLGGQSLQNLAKEITDSALNHGCWGLGRALYLKGQLHVYYWWYDVRQITKQAEWWIAASDCLRTPFIRHSCGIKAVVWPGSVVVWQLDGLRQFSKVTAWRRIEVSKPWKRIRKKPWKILLSNLALMHPFALK